MLDIIATFIEDVKRTLVEELYELPLISPRNIHEEQWFPIIELTEIIIVS
jgi:hypothetical protein